MVTECDRRTDILIGLTKEIHTHLKIAIPQLRRFPAVLACLRWEENLAESFVASRLNGYLGGEGTVLAFNRD